MTQNEKVSRTGINTLKHTQLHPNIPEREILDKQKNP